MKKVSTGNADLSILFDTAQVSLPISMPVESFLDLQTLIWHRDLHEAIVSEQL